MTQSAQYPSLEGKSVFITGGATGIGASLVEAFHHHSANVGFVDIDAVSGEALAMKLRDRDTQQHVFFAQTDVTETDALQASVADFANQNGGQLDILINNAANDTRHDPAEVTPEYWRKAMAINLDAAFFSSQTAITFMQEQGQGRIINFGSINAIFGPENMPAYVAAKSALMGLTKALANQYGVDGIRVNAILPGWVVTDRQLKLWLTPEAENEWMEQVALKERIMPEDVANLALFLASDESRMITGQSIVIDGGRV